MYDIITLYNNTFKFSTGPDYGHNIRDYNLWLITFGEALLPKTIWVNWIHCGFF